MYNLGEVSIGERSVVSQYGYLCNGTHDLSVDNLPLMIGKIEIGDNVFMGARSMILPGLKIGDGAVIGAGAVVTKDVAPGDIVGGNPAKFIKKREYKSSIQ